MTETDAPRAVAELAATAESLLGAVGDFADVTLLRSWGNRGDDLIYAGSRRLLRDYPYREWDIRALDLVSPGKTAIVSGGGGWCKPFPALAGLLPEIEKRFGRVVVFPSSFDTEDPGVRAALGRTKAVVFARERESFEQIRPLCDARLAHDTAFFFDFAPYRSGHSHGVLHAFRRDAESTGEAVPEDNLDISTECASLDEWLWAISRHELVRTDRAHVMIAAAMLGRKVECWPSTYHKVPAIARFSLGPQSCTLMERGDKGGGRAPASGSNPGRRSPFEVALGRLRACEAELDRTAAELRDTGRALSDIRRSWSWRITAPVRAVAGLGRGGAGKGDKADTRTS